MHVLSQDLKLEKNIESYADSIKKGTHRFITFQVQRGKLGLNWLYSFKYLMNKPVFIYRESSYQNTLIVQEFYFKNGKMIYSEERLVTYHGNDSSTWEGYYYFVNGKFYSSKTMGHGKSENDRWNPKTEVLRNFMECRADISKYYKSKSTSANTGLLK